MGLRPTKGDEDALWGRQSCLQPPFRRLVSKVSRLKAGCSQDWLPHNMPASSTERYHDNGYRVRSLAVGKPG